MTKFRLIRFRYFSAFMNMALDETIMEGIRQGTTLPTIRFYGWDPSAVSIGIFQGLEYEVNRDVCEREGVDIVRRITGGGAVYHDRDGEVTYSILGPVDLFPSKVLESYELICQDVVDALQQIGIPARFQPQNDILVEERKISGNAQTRRMGILLQHGTILYRVNIEKMFSLLNVSEVKISDKLVRSIQKRVTSVGDWSPASMEALNEALEQAFSRKREIEVGDYTPAEMERARQLAQEKYSQSKWNAMR